MSRLAARAAMLALVVAELAGQARAAAPLVLTPAVQARYMLNCMGCHLPDGSGAAGKVPSVRESLPILGSTPAGRRYLVRVPGAAQSQLSNLELAEVLSWMVRNLGARPAPPGFADFSAAEVAAYRAAPLADAGATRARLLAGATGRAR